MKNVVSILLKLWPGFNGVVRYGLWSQLGISLLFGAICQLTLGVNFLWSDYLSGYWRASVGIGAFICWIFLGSVASAKLKKYEKTRNFDADGERFLEAQTHYLRGNWFETECCLKAALKKNPFDAESLLLLATLYRHVKRFSEAKKTLAELEKLEAADYWYYEIQLEKKANKDDEREAREEERAAREAAKAQKKSLKTPEPESVGALSSEKMEPISATKNDLSPISEQDSKSETTDFTPQIIPFPQNDKNSSDVPLSAASDSADSVNRSGSDAENVVELETLEHDVATNRPILKFCLNAADAPSEDVA